ELKPLLKPFLVSDLSLYFLYKDPKETLKFFVENVFPNFLNSLSYIPPDFFDFGIERNKLVEAIRKVFLRVMRFPSLRSFTFRFETKEPYFVKYSEQLKKLKYENILFFSTNTFFN
ncbi:MAG: hypothetical protein RMJ17_00380, partial [Candidatus Aenigmarchaeota archaeon]|nr:hypothetical protein [Candidatus Aenigmarchaeota archaeon]MDW8149046.1 hypothetical protein [Candidatus Aenigmarchaeota archaeon]